jgi:tRNA(Ile)-lysidine synthase
MYNSLSQKVLDFLRNKGLVKSGEKLVVAVSGGPDSVCLLHILVNLRSELGVVLHVAHLNHRLRGKDSDADAVYVAGLARRRGLPATITSRDVEAYRKKKRISLEEAAREVRYDFLADVAQKTGAAQVAVGHTADDHVETVLMHLIRGSGTQGLRGLRPLTTYGDLTIIRPLLTLTRRETMDCCRQQRLRPRRDASNFSPEPFRNRIRHYLLPELRKYNPQINEALLRTAAIAADDMDYIENEAELLWNKVARQEKGAVIINKKGLTALPPALQRHVLRRAIGAVRGNLKDIEAGHIEAVLNALGKPAGKVIGLPSGLNFTIESDRYVLATDSLALCPLPPLENEVELNIPGRTVLPGWDIEAEITAASEYKKEKGGNADFTAYFDFERTGSRLTVRSRRPGDRFRPLGLRHYKKLNQYMIDAGIPRSWRRRVPIVATPEQIIWVAGWRTDERVKVTNKTLKALRLEFRRR